MASDNISDWVQWLEVEKGCSRNTVISYQTDISDFRRFISEHAEIDITLSAYKVRITDLRSWLSSRIRRNYSARSNARALSAVRSFFSYQLRCGVQIPDFIFKFRAPRVTPLLPRPLTQGQAELVINYEESTENLWIKERNQALFALLYGAGLRINEALSLNHININLDQKEVSVFGKGGKQRIVPLLPVVCGCLSRYISLCPYPTSLEAPIFYGAKGKRLQAAVFERHMAKIKCELNLKDSATPHALRHSFASHLVANGMGIRTVQELLGHASLASTQVYTDISDSKLMEVYRGTHPLNKKN